MDVEAIAMKTKLIIWLSLTIPVWLLGQNTDLQVQTFPTNAKVQHMHLNLRIPAGEVFIKASHTCGQSYFKLYSDDSKLSPQVEEGFDANGNWMRTLALDLKSETPPKQVAQGSMRSSSADFSQQMLLNSSGNTESLRSTYSPDPSISTDLYLDLGVGRSRLDLSDLSLNSVKIHSAFADLHITFTQANRVSMEKMDIHAAKAKIVLKNMELARADVISIVNDMGDTKMVLGSNQYAGTTIYVQQGMGDFLLIVHPDHPTKIILKNGLFSSTSLPEGPDGFERQGQNTFVNKAYQKSGDENATTLICTIDFGSISVFSGR
jgi:hypothetical protein